MFDIYEANLDNSARFVIGEAGSRPLHIIALNPSTADQNKSDTTITKIKNFSKKIITMDLWCIIYIPFDVLILTSFL